MVPVPPAWSDRFAKQAAALKDRQRWRSVRVIEQRQGVRDHVEGAWRLNFCSNDYLGLAADTPVPGSKASAGAGSAHLVCGHTTEHAQLERELCDWLQAESALLVGSGYLGNLAAITGLCGTDDLCVQDKLNHASLIDAAQLAGCTHRRYPHLDMEGLVRQRHAADVNGLTLVASDAVFSMDGDAVDAPSLRSAAGDALLYLDEAHSVGVLGAQGQGLGMGTADLRLVTFGKAIGTYGAALLGDRSVIDHLRNHARPTIFTTALPPMIAWQTTHNIRQIRTGDRLRALRDNCDYFLQRTRNLPIEGASAAIFTLHAGTDAAAMTWSQRLWDQGLWVSAIRPPTVPQGKARLRITLSALHTRAEIDQLVDALSA